MYCLLFTVITWTILRRGPASSPVADHIQVVTLETWLFVSAFRWFPQHPGSRSSVFSSVFDLIQIFFLHWPILALKLRMRCTTWNNIQTLKDKFTQRLKFVHHLLSLKLMESPVEFWSQQNKLWSGVLLNNRLHQKSCIQTHPVCKEIYYHGLYVKSLFTATSLVLSCSLFRLWQTWENALLSQPLCSAPTNNAQRPASGQCKPM